MAWRNELVDVITGELALTPVEPTDRAAIRHWYGLRCDVVRADLPDDPQPCWADQLGQFRAPWPGEDETVWLARTGGTVVGGCLLNLPTRDNLDNAAAHILVAPDHRRRGIGRALLGHLSAAASRHGRLRLVSEIAEPLDASSPGARFAAASGARLALAETRRRLVVGTVDATTLERLRAQAWQRAGGYSVVQWLNSTPQRWLDDFAYLTGRMLIDEPLDDLKWGPEAYDAERIREQDASHRARDHDLVTTGACDAAGRLVAFTQLVRCSEPGWYAEQWDTIVAPEHRGHRLGTLIKIDNLALARARHPDLRVVDTRNADSNPFMVEINEAIGFRPHDRWGEWQLELSRAAPAAVSVSAPP